MRDAVILGQFNDLGVNEDEFDIFRPGTEQEADNDRVDADGFTAAGGTCNQQVGHLAKVGDLGRTGDILAQGHRQRAAHIDVVLRLKDRTNINGGTNLIGNFDADGGLCRGWSLDTDTRSGQVQGDIIGQACDAADLDTSLRLQFVPGDRGTAADIQHRGLDAEAVQRVDEDVGVLLHFAGGTGFIVGTCGVKEVDRRIAVRLGGCSSDVGSRMALESALVADGGVWMGALAELPTAVETRTRAASPCCGTVKLSCVVSATGRVMVGAGCAAGSAASSSSISETERPDCQAALTALPVSVKLPPSVRITAGARAGATGATGTDGAGDTAQRVVWAAKSAGEMTIVSPCTRPVISSCGSCSSGSGSSLHRDQRRVELGHRRQRSFKLGGLRQVQRCFGADLLGA